MKGKLKKGFIMLVVILGVVGSISTVFAATRYTSTLSLGKGKNLIGATRNYPAGNNYISIYVDSFTKTSGKSYTKLKTFYFNDMGNYSVNVGSQVFTISTTGKLLVKEWGQLSAGNRYYSFSTKIDDVNHGGVQSDTVIMASI